MNAKIRIATLMAASGAVAATATAQPFAIYGGGATLQADFFQSPFATFDYIDADLDGWADALGTTGAATGGLDIDQLVVNSTSEASLFRAQAAGSENFDNLTLNPTTGVGGNSWAHLYYRRVGSGNGIAELLFKGRVSPVGADVDGNGEMPYDNLADNQDGDPYLNLAPDGSVPNDFLNTAFASQADFNRALIIDNGMPVGGALHNANNRGGVPYRMFADNSYLVAQNTGIGDATGSTILTEDIGGTDYDFTVPTFPGLADDETGVRMMYAAADVPFAWFAQVPGEASPLTVPGAPGYGINPIEAVNPDGSPAGTDNNLIDVAATNVNTNTANPDANTVFDTALVLTPVAPIVNYGVGLEQIDMSDLRTLSATGRRMNGENLVKVTRDSGSGTRNAFMNGIGLDPAWGRGENVGVRNGDDNTTGRLGPSWLPSNKNGSSRMDFAVEQHRLAVGHTGAERNGSWLDDNELEILAVRNDGVRGQAAARGDLSLRPFVRPNLERCLDGSAETGFIIIGPASISTIGDPRRAQPEAGGFGWQPAISGENPMDRPVNFDEFAPQNPAVAAFVNNITRSAEAFVAFAVDPMVPLEEQPIFTPGASLAFQFVPPQAAANTPVVVPDPSNETIPVEANPGFNLALANFIENLPGGFVNDLVAVGDTFQSDQGGSVPSRQAGFAYSEFTDPNALSNAQVSTGSTGYVTQNNTLVNYGATLPAGSNLMRNKIAGDFDGDEARTPADVVDMLEAYWDRIGGPNWDAPNGSGPNNSGANGGFAIIEMLGDFTGDGNFDAADIRYWGDGLHLTTTAGIDWDIEPGVDLTHNRLEGFTAIDAAAAIIGIQEVLGARGPVVIGDGFFRTTLANPNATYDNGDAACDVAGSGAFTVGNNPIGWDRVVDAQDIDYVAANFGDFTDLEQAVLMDLSCDMNGDLEVNDADIDVIFACLETERGDFDLDGDIDQDDRDQVEDGMGDGYATGDFDLDGDVDADDLAAFNASFMCNAADLGQPFGTLDIADVVTFLQFFGQSNPAADLGAPMGVFDIADVVAFLQTFGAGCP